MFWLLPCAFGATLSVGPNQTYVTISDAVDDAWDGDVIEVHPGTYVEDVVVFDDIAIVGVGDRDAIVVTSAGGTDVVTLWGDGLLQGFTVDGAGIARGIHGDNQSDLVLRDMVVRNGAAPGDNGGGLGGGAWDLTIEGCRFEGNTARFGGAVYIWPNDLRLVDTVFEDNHADIGGGAVDLFVDFDEALIEDNTFVGNTAQRAGAVSLTLGEDVRGRLIGNTFCDNSATDEFGALHLVGHGGVLAQVIDNLFDHNEAHEAAALGVRGFFGSLFDPALTLVAVRNTFVGNVGHAPGSAIDLRGKDVDVTFHNNVVAHTSGTAGPAMDTAQAQNLDYNLWFDNAHGDIGGANVAGASAVFADPAYTAYVADGDCTNDDFTPLPTSPLVDAGNPAFLDDDGSPSDIGHRP